MPQSLRKPLRSRNLERSSRLKLSLVGRLVARLAVATDSRAVSEDDFDEENKREVNEYKDRQAAEHRRLKIKEENVKRKEQGKELLTVPRKAKEKTKRLLAYGSDASSSEEEEEDGGTSGRKRKRNEEDDYLSYEGREFCFGH